MVFLKNSKIRQALTRTVHLRKAHECACCGAPIAGDNQAVKVSFTYDGKLYPVYLHSINSSIDPAPCYEKFMESCGVE